jgi:hypothetical protein
LAHRFIHLLERILIEDQEQAVKRIMECLFIHVFYYTVESDRQQQPEDKITAKTTFL